MSHDTIDAAKETILRCIHDLIEIAEREDERSMPNKLKAQQELLEGLDKRIERNQLPDGFVRSVINDIRLDVRMIYSDIKILLTLTKQEAAAPTAKLKRQAHDRLAEYRGDTSDSAEAGSALGGDKLPKIELMMNKLKEIEHLLNESWL